MVTIEIDDKKVEARPGQMIIEAADSIGIEIPRFCYHKKLSIAANCRMCLVEVEKAPKPLPACATPVSDGMKIYTTSNRAREAQKAVMEFLLINHPLDCPICDQGGQCELQDVALEYGKSSSRYSETKRVVKDKDIGPLISTDMTRCIHCTRCVRFGAEIAGQRELGATGRGEFMEIGTYIEKSVNSELSGNVIDLCPVGALTSKPFRFQARAWELTAMPSVSAHDCVGSHLFFHAHDDKVMRALPRENEELNEVWLSDRDRFSYEGFNHPERLTKPWIKKDNKWKEVDWPTALSFAVENLQKVILDGPENIGALASPNSTCEEFYLLQKILRHQGCHNIDHRLRQIDNRHQEFAGAYPNLGIKLNELETQEHILIIGSNIQKEQPLINHRIRKAQLHGAKIFAVNPWEVSFNFAIESQMVSQRGNIVQSLMEVVKAVLADVDNERMTEISPEVQKDLAHVMPSDTASTIAKAMLASNKNSIILGSYAWDNPEAHLIYVLSRVLAQLTQATWGEMSNGANSAGGWLSGAVPHRLPMGQHDASTLGLTAQEMMLHPRKGYILLGCEPELDCAVPKISVDALKQAQIVVALTAFDSEALRDYADVLLPITPISEMSGTYVNAFGDWHSFTQAVNPYAQSRPAWKVLRVMANLWDIPGFNYQSSEEILGNLKALRANHPLFSDNLLSMPLSAPRKSEAKDNMFIRLAPTSLYHVDGITRRAPALAQAQDADVAKVIIHADDASRLGLQIGQQVWVIQDGNQSTTPLPIEIDSRIPQGVAMVAASIKETQTLGAPFGLIELKPS